MLFVGLAALASVAPKALDPLSLLGDNKAAQKSVLRSYTPLPGCSQATLAMS